MYNKITYLSLMLLLSFNGYVKGSCLEYGHSCWGAHGKRSGSGGKIYRSIDGSGSQQSDGNREGLITQDQVKPRELFDIILDRNSRLEDARNSRDLNMPNSENENIFLGSEQRLRRKLKDAFRKGVMFQYSPKAKAFAGPRSSTEATEVKRDRKPSPDSSSEYYHVDNYPLVNLEMEYLDLK